eukprot:5360649-Prymnesium_polylepis.1
MDRTGTTYTIPAYLCTASCHNVISTEQIEHKATIDFDSKALCFLDRLNRTPRRRIVIGDERIDFDAGYCSFYAFA